MYGCPKPPTHATHDSCTNYIFQHINAKLSHSHTHSQLTAMATAAANAAAMSPLQAAEQHLGSINTWPSSIIFSLFAETPSATVIEYLTDFFSGNALPKTLAYKLYSACNPEAANELVRQLFYTRFSLWHSSDTVRRHSLYYDLRLKKLVRRNVPYLPEFPEEKTRTSARLAGSTPRHPKYTDASNDQRRITSTTSRGVVTTFC